MNTVRANELTDDYFDIATSYFNSKNTTKAIEYLDLILTIEPDNLPAQTLKNKIAPPIQNCVQTPDLSPMTQSTVVEEKPTAKTEEKPQIFDSDYYNNKGLEYYQKKDYDNARTFFYKAITVNKHNAQAYNNLAMVYWLKNNTCEAIKNFNKASSIDKCYTQPLVNLSKLYNQLGNYEKQLYYLKKAVKNNPKDYLAYFELGNYFKDWEDYYSAINSYKNVVRLNPEYSQVYINLALCFFQTEQFNYCLIAAKQYQEFYLNSDFAYYIAARADLAICQYDDAKVYINKALKINNLDEYRFELGKIEYYLQNYEPAMELFRNVLKSSENAECFNYLGLCNYKLKNLDSAIAYFQTAIEMDGLKPIYYYNLAQCYKSRGEQLNYTKYLSIATKINPINYQDYIDLSYIYYDNGNIDKTINTLDEGIKKYPDTKSIYLAKLKIYEAIGDNLHYNEIKDLIDMRFNKK